MKQSARLLALLAALVFCLLPARAQQPNEARFDFYTRGPYREAVPRPQAITRYDVGDFHTNYATMERVIDRIAQSASDRVRVFDMGLTNEYRMMKLLAISSPENIARLEEIKANIARLSDPRRTGADEARRIVDATPIVVWLAYTIHGNESASFETMMQVVYQLAASDEPATLEMLRNTVVLVNVCENPDGHERFVTWYNSVGIGNPDPSANEHREPWTVWGRANHYRFDLNRDNLAASQLETRHMQRAYLEWNPQVLVDHHGQTTQYFFPPAALPINPNLPSAPTARWLNAFGRANAAQFDARQWDYYVRDVFDIFYPGYWDSWPSLNGATGMTFETDAGGPRGYNWRRDDDTIITFRTGIAKHFVASLTVLETAAQNRAARLGDYYEFKRSALEEGRTEPLKRFVIVPGNDPARAGEVVEILLNAGVEIGVAREGFSSARAHGYASANAPAQSRQFPAGSYVVDLAQPQKRLVKAFLEPETPLDATFAREQLARFQRNQRRGTGAAKEDYSFYDITAWSLPLAFGVETYWTEDAGGVQVTPLTRTTPAPDTGAVASPAERNRMRVPEFVRPGGGVTGRASIAYV
ncbi:MAG: M14 family zinc carboxypeptidase, partial [Pyrinomonadaceae bacterium]